MLNRPNLSTIHICFKFSSVKRKKKVKIFHFRGISTSLIGFGPPNVQTYLIEYVLENVILMSEQKYSSNVVEMCIDFATVQQREHAVDLICSHEAR